MPDRESILAMEAGPELDALVAERVMEWTGVHDNSGGPPWGPMEGPRFVGSPSSQGVANRPVPDYSSDIAAAWEVVEKMDEVMWTFTWLTDSRVWQARFIDILPMPEAEAEAEAEAPTAPLAICRAALLTTLARDVTPTSTE